MSRARPTRKNRPVNSQETVLERLLEVLLLESLLLGNNLVQVLACVDSDLVTAMSVVYSKERYPRLGTCRLVFLVALERLEIEDGGVGVLHAYPPSLHAADTVGDAIILTLVRVLERRITCQRVIFALKWDMCLGVCAGSVVQWLGGDEGVRFSIPSRSPAPKVSDPCWVV
jgi:hypothetical protein